MEEACRFVSSRGLLASCTFHSENPMSSCGTDTRYLDRVLTNIKPYESIYVCSELLPYFRNNILPVISVPFVLVTGDSDLSITDEYKSMIESPLLTRWFAQNAVLKHPKLIQMPIGLDYHTVFANPSHEWVSLGEGITPKEQESLLLSIRNKALPLQHRLQKIYVNFGWISADRRDALQSISRDLLWPNLYKIKRTTVWNNIASTAFVLSPFGNGMDCHRTWEALVLGAIPIIKGHHFDAMLAGLPVLIVDDWSEITEDLLVSAVKKFSTVDYTKLELRYWTTLMLSSPLTTRPHPPQIYDLD